MEQKKISRSEMLKFAFNTLIDNFGFWVGALLTQFGIILAAALAIILGGGLGGVLLFSLPLGLFLLTFGLVIAMFYTINMLMTGSFQIGLDFYDTRTSFLSRLWTSDAATVFNFMVGALLYTIMVSIGLFFFVIPGIYLAIKFWFFGQIIVDQNKGPIQAFKTSSELTHGNMLDLGVTILLITLTGIIPLVGVYLIILCNTYVYRQLQPRLGASQQSPHYGELRDTAQV